MTRTGAAAFIRTGGVLGRDILIALAIKLSLLTFLYYCFFAESHRPRIDPETTAAALLEHPTVKP